MSHRDPYDLTTPNPFVNAYLAELDPAEQQKVATKIQRLAAGRDNAPSGRGATQATPLSQLDVVTSRFDVSRIPLSRLGQMRRDPIIAFVLFFVLSQLTRARWMMKSQDPQAAAFADNALRQIYPGLVASYVEKLAYGYQAVIKRFQQALPTWTYIDPADPSGGEKPVWSNGTIKATIFKPFIPIHPMAADPIWANDGSFGGIKYTPGNITTLSGSTGSGDTETVDYDVLQSLWFTNELESVHNSLWGYPRTGYAYRFWWSFWFNWGLADRHFEKDADPPVRVYYPPNKPMIDGLSTRDLALMVGDRARSNSTIALPNDLIEKLDGTVTNVHEWEVDFVKGGGNFEVFKERFDQINTFMFRAMMAPPDTFDSAGGTAGYNSQSNLVDLFTLSQNNLITDFDFTVNDYILPQLMAANGFQAKVTKITKGFDATDMELATAILQGAANSATSDLNDRIDWDELLDITGIPRLSLAEIAEKQAQLPQTAPAAPPLDPGNQQTGDAGVTPQGLYYRPREIIRLSEQDRVRLLRGNQPQLPRQVQQFADPVIHDDSQRLQSLWVEAIGDDYRDAAMLLQEFDGTTVSLDENFYERWWRRSQNRAQQTAATTRRVLASIMRRASTVEIERAGLRDFAWDPSFDDRATQYLAERGADLVSGISETTRDEIKRYLADLQGRGVDSTHMSDLVRSHFAIFAGPRADRLVRSEIGKAYNMATLFAGQQAGFTNAQAIDAQLGESRSDPECIKRNGRVYSIADAFVETEREHPNGTLAWKLIK